MSRRVFWMSAMKHPDHGAPILCRCGADPVAVAPRDRGHPVRAWCLRHWHCAEGGDGAAAENTQKPE